MLPWAEEIVKHRQSKEDPEANCLPAGIPRGSPYPWRIVQTPTHYFILYEGNIHSFRQIFMNGKHPDDPDPTWYGHSIGHWEGNTLVVDTVGFNDKFWFDYKGHPHTEKLHTIERYSRTDLGHMSIEVTIDDPGAYTKPFTTVGKARLMPGDRAAGVHLPGEQPGSAATHGSSAGVREDSNYFPGAAAGTTSTLRPSRTASLGFATMVSPSCTPLRTSTRSP